MNETMNWDDLRLFLAVARAAGLGKAARKTQVSAPTLGRRMTALERSLGASLFRRHRRGYDLTSAGKELLERAEAFERAALDVERWQSATDIRPLVKIAAGDWTSAFVARHILDVIDPKEELAVEILTGISPSDLLRRQANLGLRNRRPDTPGLAGRRLVQVAFAIYGEKALVRSSPEARDERRYAACRWIAFSPPGPKVPSAVWLDQQLESAAQIICSTAMAVLESALAGAGLCVLPCFIGDADRRLTRASETIAALVHDQWLVTHDDDRHDGQIKIVSERLATLIRSNEALFSGRQIA